MQLFYWCFLRQFNISSWREDVQFWEAGQQVVLYSFAQCLYFEILRFESGAWGGRRGESDLGDSLLKTKAGKLATEAWTLTWMGDSLRGNEEEGWRLSAIILQWSWKSLKEQFQKNPPVTGHASNLSVDSSTAVCVLSCILSDWTIWRDYWTNSS